MAITASRPVDDDPLPPLHQPATPESLAAPAVLRPRPIRPVAPLPVLPAVPEDRPVAPGPAPRAMAAITAAPAMRVVPSAASVPTVAAAVPGRVPTAPVPRPDDAPTPRPVPAAPVPRPVPAARLARAARAARAEQRAAGELDRAHRIALADRIQALVRDAEQAHPWHTAPLRAHRSQVLEARGRLGDIDHALRSGMPLHRHGERLVARLLSDDRIGTYCHGDPRAMRTAADAACTALGLHTPFH